MFQELLLALIIVLLRDGIPVAANESSPYTNEWAAHIPGGQGEADHVARDLGYENLGQVDTHFILYIIKSFKDSL